MTSTDSPEAGLVERGIEIMQEWIERQPAYQGDDAKANHYKRNRDALAACIAALSPPSPDRDSVAKAIATAAGATWPQDAGRYRKLADAALSALSPDREAIIRECAAKAKANPLVDTSGTPTKCDYNNALEDASSAILVLLEQEGV